MYSANGYLIRMHDATAQGEYIRCKEGGLNRVVIFYHILHGQQGNPNDHRGVTALVGWRVAGRRGGGVVSWRFAER